jgi:hypothetical protein
VRVRYPRPMGRVPLGRACAAAIVGVFIAGFSHVAPYAPAPAATETHPAVFATIVEEATATLGHADTSRLRMPSVLPPRALAQQLDALSPVAIVLLALLALRAAATSAVRTPGRRPVRVASSRGPPYATATGS